VIGAEAEFGQERPRRLLGHVRGRLERREQLPAPQLVTLLCELTEHDRVADDASAFGEGDAADNRIEQRRLAAAVRPDQRVDAPGGEVEVEVVEGDEAAEALR
jgi:hypothetical protein